MFTFTCELSSELFFGNDSRIHFFSSFSFILSWFYEFESHLHFWYKFVFLPPIRSLFRYVFVLISVFTYFNQSFSVVFFLYIGCCLFLCSLASFVDISQTFSLMGKKDSLLITFSMSFVFLLERNKEIMTKT